MPIKTISQPPPALTQEELSQLSASTPASFEGIAPLLKLKQDDVFWTIEPDYEGLRQSRGTLWVTEDFLSADGSTGLSIPYENITLHALSRAALPSLSSLAAQEQSGSDSATVEASGTNGSSNGASNGLNGSNGHAPTTTGPCVYCQINEFENEEAEDYDKSWEVMIIPSDEAAVDRIFEAMSQCASLHPSSGTGPASGGPQIAGLDLDSLVYADEDGNVHGPESFDDAEDDEEGGEGVSQAGAIRSNYVADTRKKPY